ncbi:hypothetical protein GCM10008983_02060 [Lentibacillus halophilus]|uniref:HTH gntR-type domain-containing protein n=1 Tax=Lentibacillus halophilus TaxID=295065 RepID=A0ABN0Z1Y2_9BACI
MSAEFTEVDSNGKQFVDRDLYRDVIGHFASGVTIITTRKDETDFGITASAVASLSMDPPMLIVCVNKQTGTCNAISESKKFGVNILHEDQSELAKQFARANTDKFQGVDTTYGEMGEPLLNDVLAHLECRVAEEVTGGTHSVFLAEVQNAQAEQGMPLAYFRGKFGHFQDANDERVFREIRKMVLERNFQPDQTLNINDLAYQFDVPRQAVYYAMIRLESNGLINRMEEDHYRVSPLDTKTLNEALDTRSALEIAAVEQTVGHLSDQQLDDLKKRMKDTLPKNDGSFLSADQYTEANQSFHDFTVAIAENTTLLNSYRQVTAEEVMASAIRAALLANDQTAHNELTSLADDHIALVEAFEAGDKEKAISAIKQHTENAKRLGHYLIDSAGGHI